MDPENPKIWRKRPKQERSENTANVILQAAEQLFIARGFHHTTSDDIAQRAGVGVGSLYDYFPNKAAIALALLERTAMSLAQDSRKFLVENGAEDLESSLPRVIRGLYEAYKQQRSVLIDLVADVPELRAPGVYTLDRMLYRASLMYLQLYRDRFPDIDLETTHAFLIHIFTSSIKHYLAAPDVPLDEEEFLDRLSETIVGYLIDPPRLVARYRNR